MKNIFENSKWIWASNSIDIDDYAEFISTFKSPSKNVIMRIACDTVYALYLNDKLIKFMICSDFPEEKFYDEINLDLDKEENELRITVWHYGHDTHTSIKDVHGVIFEVIDGNQVILNSCEKTLSRVMNEFKNGYKQIITSQQGYSFYIDNTVTKNLYADSIIVDKKCNYSKRELNDILLLDRLEAKKTNKEDYVLIDIGKETTGLADLDFISEKEQELLITYGEHLKEGGKVLRSWAAGVNDFSFKIKAKKGHNIILNPLKKIAGRYLEVYSESSIKINYIGIRPISYKKEKIEYAYKDPLISKINDICLNTLDCCMLEHYMDCPWREQALYTLDMRNQMLCGYTLFKGYEYQKHNLLLVSKGLNKYGLISLCVPSNMELPIPSFSLHYIVAVKEYLENTNDMSILPVVKPVMKTIMNTMLSRIDNTGLIHYFPKPYWNFYEWTEESHNNDDIPLHCPPKDQYDLIINALLVYVIPIYNKLLGNNIEIENKKAAIKKYFYDEDKGVYLMSTKSKKYSQLGNILAYSIGLGDEKLLDKIINDKNMITISLSMKGFLYEPLLKLGGKYEDYIINDIKQVYGLMLEDGATSCYESAINTNGIGRELSHCHGWSALPAYYFAKILNK